MLISFNFNDYMDNVVEYFAERLGNDDKGQTTLLLQRW